MGKPAARITDMHVCPMVDGVKPHVGGPITGPGVPNVLIGGMPAVTQGDMCTCVGPPDIIAMGSTGVLIGGKPAARMMDITAHGGSIMAGCPTVLIGDTGAGSRAGNSGAIGESAQESAQISADHANNESLKNAAKNGADEAEQTTKDDFSTQYTLIDEAGQPIKDVSYEMHTSDGDVYKGKTDASGKTQKITGYTEANCRIIFLNK